MANTTSDTINTINAPERHSTRAVHYEISYIVQGAEHGPDGAIVLLHDFPSGAFTWEPILPQLAELGRAVYAIDMLGFGLSEHPWPADTSVWGQADVLNFLLRQLNLTNVVLVGNGLGGSVAQILATRLFRERTAALVMIDTLSYLRAFAENWPMTDMTKRQDFDAAQQISLEDMMTDLRNTLPNGSANPQGFSDALNNYVQQWDSELGKEVLFQHIRLLIPNYVNSVASDLRVLNKPTLIIWGAEDQQFPVSYADRLHREIAGSSIAIIPDAGHLILFDAPNAVAEALNSFIGSL